MKVYIRHFEEGDTHLLTEVATAAEAEAVAQSVGVHGAYTPFDDPTHLVATQYIVADDTVGFEIIVGLGT